MPDDAIAAKRSLSLRKKLALAIVLAALVPLLTASAVSYFVARNALADAAETRLTVMRDQKKRALTEYFEEFARALRLLSASPVAQQGMRDLSEGWTRLPDDLGAKADAANGGGAGSRADTQRGLTEYHLAQAAANVSDAAGKGGDTVPKDPSAHAAQVLFLLENPHPPEAKHLLVRPTRGGSAYGEAHARVHAYASRVAQTEGWDDLLFVDARTGFVVYSYAKRLDFATSVHDGPFAKTGLGQAARRALDATTDHEAFAEDFEVYAPSRGRPTAFLAAPVRVDGRTVGVLVAHLPVAHVNALLAPEPGTSASSETYLVGRDHLMRSDSRFERESTILKRSLDSHAVRESLAGNTGVGLAPDYRGVDGVLAWAPVEVMGLKFGLVRKIDAADAFEPSRRLLYWMAGIAGLLVLLALGAGVALSRSLARPVAEATERLQGMAQSLLSTAQQQQAGAAEAAAAVEETRQTFTSVLGAAKDLRKVGTEVLGNAEISQRNAQTIGRRIQDLSSNTAHIGEILSIVKEIANRSDLLALNAALEGTKAGEAGRGFSLVATQMQRLAEEVMQSVKKIEGLTDDISKASAGAVLAAEEADKVASRTTSSAQHIAEAVETQQAATEQVSVAMNEIATVAQNSVDSARTIVSSSNGLLGVAADLRRVMGSGA